LYSQKEDLFLSKAICILQSAANKEQAYDLNQTHKK